MPKLFAKKTGLILALIPLLVTLSACQTIKIEPILGDKIGVLLMHGKGGTQRYISSLASSLEGAGIIVETPLMPWGKGRIYDKSYEESMDEIDGYVRKLKVAGAKRIVIAGHSIGANAALGYAARRQDLSGVILLAYGHVPGIRKFGYRLASSVTKAKSMIESGRGESSSTFKDANQGGNPIVRGTANDVLSWFDSDGPATIKYNAPQVDPETPILCVYGRRERAPKCSSIRWDLPSSLEFNVVEVNASHLGTPSASIEEVGKWLREL